MPPETTYERYKRALEEIADNAQDPVTVAMRALYPDRPPPSYKWKYEAEVRAMQANAVRTERRSFALKTYNNWLAKGRPPIAAYARSLGLQRSKMERLLRHAERGMPWGSRRLGHTRSRDYRTADEIIARDDQDAR